METKRSVARLVAVPARARFIALTAAACSLVGRGADAQRTRFADRDGRARIDTTFAFDRRGTVSLSVGGGEIIVRGWSKAEMQVRAVSDNENIRFDVSSNRVSLDLARGRGGDTRFEVTVPQGVRVVARSGSGDISIRGTKGEVEVHTQGGDVDLEDVANRLDANLFSGELRARAVSGDIDIGTLSGDIDLDDLRGNIDVHTTSGEIRMRNVTSKLVRAKTTSGGVLYAGTIDPAGRYDLVAHSGDVSLAIPRDASAQLTIATWSGEIESDFPMTLKPGEHGIGSTTTKRFTFDIGGGAARITAETFSGDITIRRTGR
jgi:DUF4097 and DUF4098 domain-containing protein YvlB